MTNKNTRKLFQHAFLTNLFRTLYPYFIVLALAKHMFLISYQMLAPGLLPSAVLSPCALVASKVCKPPYP